jgi:sugar phosphate isomerase/epimerase
MKKLKQILRHSLLCMVAIVLFQMVWDAHLAAQDVVPPTLGNLKPQTSNIAAALVFHFSDGEEREWLRIENHDPRTKDFHPSLTNIVCDYKPIVRKLGPNKYEITFTSEIAEDLP